MHKKHANFDLYLQALSFRTVAQKTKTKRQILRLEKAKKNYTTNQPTNEPTTKQSNMAALFEIILNENIFPLQRSKDASTQSK